MTRGKSGRIVIEDSNKLRLDADASSFCMMCAYTSMTSMFYMIRSDLKISFRNSKFSGMAK